MTAGPPGGRPSPSAQTGEPSREATSTHDNGSVTALPLPLVGDAPWLAPIPPRHPRVYVDGSALSRFLDGAPEGSAWREFVARRHDQLMTSVLGVNELRRTAQLLGAAARDQADAVAGRLEVVGFSDQSLREASRVSGVMAPFVALHLGTALATPDVHIVATYDTDLARVCVLHGLAVVTPGWPDRWWERVH